MHFIPQGIASDIVRYLAFFSYFTIQMAQLFLCCFADQPPQGKPNLEKVGREECIHQKCPLFPKTQKRKVQGKLFSFFYTAAQKVFAIWRKWCEPPPQFSHTSPLDL